MSGLVDTISDATPTGSTDVGLVIANCIRDDKQPTERYSSGDEENSEDTDGGEVIMTVYCKSGRLGAACYTLQTGELQMLEEIQDRQPEHQIFISLYNQISPATLIMDGKAPATFVNVIKSVTFNNENNDEGRCKLVFVSAKEYNFEACKRRIYSLSLPHEPTGCGDEERVLFLRTVVDFSHTQSVHALGTLLRYLDLNWCNLNLDLHGKPEFLTFKRISLNDIVTIDGDTYKGLQIFNSLSHPSGFKKGVQGSNKEGLSLFQLFSKCSSKVGYQRMRVFLRHPTSDLATLNRRQDVVEFFMKPQNDAIMRNICSSLRFIKNVNGILAKMKALSAKSYQWKSLYNTLYNAVLICEICEAAGHACEYLEELASCDTNKLYEMALYMNRIIDFDLSKSEGKFTVKAGVDADLDRKKQTMASLHGLMSETAKVEMNRLPPFVQECTMLYMPYLGYMLGVRAWANQLSAEEKELPNMKFMFQNDDYIHYKTKGCDELDVMVGDTYPDIVAHETRIMMRLTSVVLEGLAPLAAVVDKCAELDCLITISKVCKELNFVRPKLTSEKVIDIKQGKHPLYVATCDTFVPNDLESSAGAGFVKILTGPNASGKSVFMKQIGLIVYMAHIGSFVPAERAQIGVVTSIYSRIQSTECVAAHMSAFLIDLRQMALAVRECGSASLVLVDEFGKGTGAQDGLALLAACVNTLLFREHACPHLLLSTHFLNIRQYVVDTPILNFLRFEHVMEGDEPVFLFRAVEGVTSCSYAAQVAAASGISPDLVARSKTVLEAITRNELPPPAARITAKMNNIIDAMIQRLVGDI